VHGQLGAGERPDVDHAERHEREDRGEKAELDRRGAARVAVQPFEQHRGYSTK
jgi:hypothetical protein